MRSRRYCAAWERIMDFREFLKNNTVYLDGGMGTLLQSAGLKPGELPERLNISRPELIRDIHRAYFEAGSNVVATNTFGANSLKLSEDELEAVIRAALENADAARREANGEAQRFIALDVGPLGKLLSPLGTLDFEDAVEVFKKTVRLGAKYGAELVLIETMSDSYETKAAVLAARESCDLPVIVTNAYGSDGKLMTGAEPEAMVALLEGMGVSALGANCSLGPRELMPVLERLLAAASVPVVMKPNAGLPKIKDGKTVFGIGKEEFAEELAKMARLGCRVLGGCCGTTPEYIEALVDATSEITPVPLSDKGYTAVSSYTHALYFGASPVLIGERINPTGKKPFREALKHRDMDFILGEAIRQEKSGAHVLDVNVGLPELDETALLRDVVCELQTVTDLPLQIDTSNIEAMEAALRRYNGCAMINSVSGKQSSMDAVFPLVKKYGGVVVALTLDEDGIPEDAEGRVKIAKKIAACAEEYGIGLKNLIFDPLTLTVSADARAARVTLDSLARIKAELGAKTSLGVSNVSFGLPNRDVITSTFFALALSAGLDAAIMNPTSPDMMRVYYAYRALSGLDEGFADYIARADELAITTVGGAHKSSECGDGGHEFASELQYAIVKGLADKAERETDRLLLDTAPLDIVSEHIIPALNYVGEGFEKKTIYLPSLLISAETAKRSFERIKLTVTESSESEDGGIPFVLATVKGDIHDIGKNIVKLILENYGYKIIDLGRDVAPLRVLDAVRESGAPLLGLSALMTTTVPAMEETVKLVKREAPDCKIIVGGAVLTAEYAEKMGADAYASDAMETVRLAKKFIK